MQEHSYSGSRGSLLLIESIMSNQRKAAILIRLAVLFIFACVLILFVAAAITSAHYASDPGDDGDALLTSPTLSHFLT